MQRLNQLSHKQLLLLGGSVGLCFIAIVLLMVFSSRQTGSITSGQQVEPTITPISYNGTQGQSNPSQPNAEPSGSPSSIPEGNNTATWQEYKGSGYAIKYPSSWQAQDKSVGNISSVVLTEQLTYTDPTAPSISVILFPDRPSYTLENRESFYGSADKRQNVTLGGIAVTKIVNEIPLDKTFGESYGNPWIETRMFTQRGNIQYEIIARYQKGASEAQNMVESILATFRLI